MDKDSKFTRDEDGYVAVRTVSAPYSSGSDDKDSMFTRDEDGYVAVRVTGSGGGSGGDQHNLGWYATESALTTAHPTAEAGDWAIVGATDTVWVWDTDTTAWKDTGAAGIELPDQTGNAGKFLTTNGTSPSWGNALTNTATGTDSLTIGGTAATVASSTNIGVGSESTGQGSVAVGNGAKSAAQSVAIGRDSETTAGMGVAIGRGAKVSAAYGIQLGGYSQTNSEQGTLYVGSYYNSTAQNYKLLDANGTIPESRLADTTNAQQGDVLTLDANGDAVWQAGSGGLPSQTGNAGKFLTTDGTDASWGNALVNKAKSTQTDTLVISGSASPANHNKNSVIIGVSASGGAGLSTSDNVVVIGKGASSGNGSNYATFIGWGASTGGYSGAHYGVALGAQAQIGASHAIQIGSTGQNTINSVPNTFRVANANGNYEMMSADGTMPTDRFTTTPSADGTYVPTLTISSGVATRSWSAPSGGGSIGTTVTLAVNDWSSNTQTVSCQGVTSSNIIIVAPAPSSNSAYVNAGILCTAQGTNSLTFTATTTPTSAITVNVVILS